MSQHNRFNEDILWRNEYPNRNMNILHVERAGITYPNPHYLIRRTRAADCFDSLFVIEYVVSGKGYIESEGRRACVGAGDLYIINRKTVHRYYADAEDPFLKKWINLDGSFMNHITKAFFLEEPFLVMPLGERAEQIIDGIHERIIRTTATDSDQMITFVMKELLDLFLLIDEYRRAEDEKRGLEERILGYIERNISLDISVNTLCREFYVSSSTLYRIFRQKFGVSPKDFILKQKIEVAKKMILDDDVSMSAVALALSFYDSHHFLKTFKKHEGIFPAEYRAACQKDAQA